MAIQTGYQPNTSAADNERFRQLRDQADGGDACAMQDLWLEFEYVHGGECHE